MTRFNQRKRVTAPENVRVVYDDGRSMPCELVYRGYEAEDDCHVWEVVNAVIDADQHFVILADVFPARTKLSFPVMGEE